MKLQIQSAQLTEELDTLALFSEGPPYRSGVSHRPDEYASPEAIADGVLVLAELAGK